MEGPADSTQPPDFVSFGHYQVARRPDGRLDELGKGAMGVTYRAYDPSLRIPVALKVVAATYVHDERARRRFRREATAAAQLSHPNIAGVKYLGEEGGEFFYVMDLIAGRPLSALLREQGKLPAAEALALMAQVASALAAAHRRELIHRDLKPANLMILEGGALEHSDERTSAAGHRQVKVIDFGLARTFGQSRAEDSLATHSASQAGFTGTPAYASPEQCAAVADLDGRADLYSLGIILWQCLAGRLPFTGSASQVLGMHQYQPPPLAHLDGLPRPVIDLIAGLLEKDPAARVPQTAGELRDRLDEFRRGPTSIPAALPPAPAPRADPAPIPLAAVPTGALGSLGAGPTLHDSDARRPLPGASAAPATARSRGPMWLGALLGMPLVALAALLLLRSRTPDAPAGPAAMSAPTASEPAAAPSPAAAPNPAAAATAKRNFATALAQIPALDPAEQPSALALLAAAQARAGDFAGAEGTMAMITGAEDQTRALIEIAAAQAKSGNTASARAAFRLAEAAAAKVEGLETRASYLGLIAKAQARSGDIAAAKATAALIRQDFLRAQAQSDIAVEQVKAGDVDGAKATAASATNSATLGLSLAQIAGAQAAAGDVAGAKETAATIRDNVLTSDAFAEIAAAQANADDIEGAKATLASVRGNSARGKALVQIALAQARVGDTSGASATVSAIAGDYDKDRALSEVAVARAKASDAAGAKSAAAKISDPPTKARALRRVAVAQAFAGDLDGAKATAVAIAIGREKSLALRGIAAAQAWGEALPPADQWANSFDRPRDRFHACLGVAEAAGAMAQGRTEPEPDAPEHE